ncbi:lipopolysaccharide transport periplasmic protein LptA [Sagittula salina]|uniref:Lipopolysaccharide transport periplasmic protein LptA n=1 Tax=Sagittula salina TaxID=2820268 RepID=A0A940S3J5_9RHOB|nr:lipopolysaccharide transport periplasmic protein LptA [Sagittula salina]MBP0483109.1 lipopolysaccharide transport periplasmic protein LptA [Sagittula salina]
MTRAILTALFLTLSMGLPAPGQAQGTEVAFGNGMQQDTSAPVEATADALSVNQKDGTALYTGNVVIVQGEMRLAAPRVLVVYSEEQGKIQRMEATGGVILVSGTEAAEAERADYDISNGTVVMTGNVLLTQGPSAVTSERMVVNLETGTANMSGRVKTVLQPADDQKASQ